MTEEHRRHLAVSIRYLDQLLEEALRAMPRLPHDRRQPVEGAVQDVRAEALRFSERFSLDLRQPDINPFHTIRVQLSVASVTVAEMRSRAMRGYGALEPPAAADLDAACDALESAIDRAQHVVNG